MGFDHQPWLLLAALWDCTPSHAAHEAFWDAVGALIGLPIALARMRR